MSSTKEKIEQVTDIMKRWQKMEKATITQTARIIEQTDHPLITQVMEIIQNDSRNHYRVQKLIIDSFTKTHMNVFTDDMADIWDAINKHNEMEKATVDLAKQAAAALEGTKNPVQLYLLDYLQRDEEKHDKLLEDLNRIKKSMYP